MLEAHILFYPFFCLKLIYPKWVKFYHERCWIILAGFEAEREWILSWWDECPSKIKDAMREFGNYPFSRISFDFNYIVASSDIAIFHGLIFSWMIWRIRTLHMNTKNLNILIFTLFQIKLFWTFCLSCYIRTLYSIHLTDYHPLNLTITSLALIISSRLRKIWPWIVSPAK